MSYRVFRCLAAACGLACALAGGSPHASPWTAVETCDNLLPSPLVLAMSVDTVYVYAGGHAADTASRPSRAGTGQISVHLSGEAVLEAEPGKVVTARFMVGNSGDAGATLEERVSSPPGWSRVAPASPAFSLGPGATAIRLITFHIPPECPAGMYDFGYGLNCGGPAGLCASGEFMVSVLPRLDLESRVASAPRSVVAGGEFAVQVALANRGNTPAFVHVRAEVRPEYDSEADTPDLLIDSGRTRSVWVRVRTERHLEQRSMCMVIVKASTSDGSGRALEVEEVVTVEVIPRVTRLTDPYYRLPSWVRVTLAADGSNTAAQLEVSGSGAIGGDQNRNLSYVLRQASRPSIGRYASWNEYWMSYRGHNIELDAGDRVYTLSPLLQRFNYGNGAGARMRLRALSAGVYYARERADEPHRREVAGFAAVALGPSVTVKANAIEKRDDTAETAAASRRFVGSLEGIYAPAPGTEFEFEYGAGSEEGGGNTGYRMWASGLLRHRLYYSVEMVHAGPRFYGYYTDTDFKLATLQYPMRPDLSLRFNYRSLAGNLELDSDKLVAGNERNIVAGLSYTLNTATRLMVDLQDFTRRDRFEQPSFDFGERTARVSIGYSISNYSLYGSVEGGYFHDDLRDRQAGLNRYSVSASFRPDQIQSYNLYGRFGDSKYAEEPRRSGNLGVAGRWHITRNLDMMLDYHMSGSPTLSDDAYRILTHSLDYVLPNRHSLSLRTSVWGGRNGGRGDMAVLLSYSVPAPIPMGRKQTVGTLKGRVYDAEDPRRAGIADVIVTADGAAAVTDSRGAFEFPSLEPGVYSLQVDARSIGLGRVTQARSPFVVTVEGGRTAGIEIGVVRACSISGDVLIFDAGAGGTSSSGSDAGPVLVGLGKGRGAAGEARGLPDVLVEISNGEYYFTQYTGSGGKFSFIGLRPGQWTVRIYPEDLPHYYFVEAPESLLDLEPGQDAHLELRILPRERRINIMDEGEIKTQRR